MQQRSSPVYSRGRLLAEDQLIGEVCHLFWSEICWSRVLGVFRCSALRFSVCLTKTKPSAAVSWSPLDREVGWFRLSLVDFGCLGSSAGCLVSSERPHSDRGAHLSVWMVSFSSNWGPAGGATSTAVHLTVQVRYRQQFVLTGTDKKFNLQILFFMWHDKLCVPYVNPKS